MDVLYSIDPEADFDSFSQSERFPSYASMTSVPKLTQSEVNLRRTSRSNSRKISNPAETIHASSERDEKPVTYIEPVKLMPKMESTSSMDTVGVVQLISRLNKMVVVFELSKARIDVCDVMLRRNSKDLQVEYTAIQLSRLRIKSSNGDEVVRGNIRTVINVNNEVDLCNLVMEANDFSVAYHLPPDKVDMIVEPVRTTIALALSHKLSNPAKLRHIDPEPNKADEPVDQQWPITYSVNVHMDMSPINIFARHVGL